MRYDGESLVQEMLNDANLRVPKIEVDQSMAWMNDENTVIVDVLSKDSVLGSRLVNGALCSAREMIKFFASQEHSLGKHELNPDKRIVLYYAAIG
tara:strand:+ start:93 stop:377 length:285 start_codon:yes stop_codon:yes gene_type:complete